MELMYWFIAIALAFLGIGVTLFFLLMPKPSRTIFVAKWFKKGPRNLTCVTNNDNVTQISMGRPRDYGIKLKKNKFFVPTGSQDLVNKRTLLDGVGLPMYYASTLTGLAATPQFLEAMDEIVGGEVQILATEKLKEQQKPKICPNPKCKETKFKTIYQKDGKGKDTAILDYFECESCQFQIQPIEVLNAHILQAMADQNYDPTNIKAIEEEARREAMTEAPKWFIWLVIGLIPYAAITAAAIILR